MSRFGNSQNVRIPKLYLEQARLRTDAEIEVQEKEIVVRSTYRPRQGWAEAFQEMPVRGDDLLFDPESANQSSWDRDEWQW